MTWNNSYFLTGVCPWAVLRLALYLKLLALRSSGLLNIISVLPVFCIFWMSSCLLLPLKGNVPLILINFLSLCDCLGVPIAHEKTEGPSTTFFGSCSSGCLTVVLDQFSVLQSSSVAVFDWSSFAVLFGTFVWFSCCFKNNSWFCRQPPLVLSTAVRYRVCLLFFFRMQASTSSVK